MSDVLKEKGNEEFAAKNYEKAVELYGDAARLDPQNPVLFSNKAMALIKLSQWPECIEACDKGLANNPDPKTKVKLLYRRGLAYAKLNDFRNAKESYQGALSIDNKNTSVLKSIEELKSQESQFKRSHSVEEIKAEKKPRTLSNIEKIPIHEVDILPKEFRDPGFKIKSEAPSSTTSITRQSSPNSQIIERKSPAKPVNIPEYPEKPTVYQLVSITKSNDQEKPYAYKYFFSLPSETYKALFAGGSLEPSLINFILDSILFTIDHNSQSIELGEKAISLLETLSSAPRFSLVGMFADKLKLQEIKEKLALQIDSQNLNLVFEKWCKN